MLGDKGSTLLLKILVLLVGFGAVVICAVLLPELTREAIVENSDFIYLKYPFLAYSYITSIPFFVALFQVLKLLAYIDKNQIFSQEAINTLKNIKNCALATIVIIVLGVSYVAIFMTGDRTPAATIGLILTFMALVVSASLSVVEKLLQNIVDIKLENELTV